MCLLSGPQGGNSLLEHANLWAPARLLEIAHEEEGDKKHHTFQTYWADARAARTSLADPK